MRWQELRHSPHVSNGQTSAHMFHFCPVALLGSPQGKTRGKTAQAAGEDRMMEATPQENKPRRRTGPSRIRDTPNGPLRLTPTEMQIVGFIERHEGYPCSKAQIAAAVNRNEKTVDRLLSHLRKNELVVSTAVHADNGAQLANTYRLTKWAKKERV